MNTTTLLNPEEWAEHTFGRVQLRDLRRTRRAVKAAGSMVREPAASLPKQLQTWKAVKALYRLLDEPDVTFEALMRPQWQQTRADVADKAVVLLVQDTTEIDLSPHVTMSGLGQIGNEKGRGLLLQTMLAVLPETRTLVGCVAQRPFVRIPAPQGEQRYQRRHRERRETDVWKELVEEVGTPAGAGLVVHVGDRGADMLPFFRSCLSTQTHFVVRATQNRRVQLAAGEVGHLLDQVRAWPSQDQRPFEVPARHGRPARQTTLQLSFGPATVLPPWNDPRGSTQPLPVWMVRVWETDPPADEEALEWIVVTSLVTQTCEQAWQRIEWYRCRWVVEEYHQCLKTGCRIEERQVHTADRFMRLLGLVSPMAVRLVQLRDLARLVPESAALQHLEPAAVTLVAARAALSPEDLTVARFWREVACLGGYLARTRDGPPGWKTLWKGWLHLQTVLEGVQLAAHLHL